MKFKAELKNDLNFSENCYYLKDNPPAFAGSEKTLHLFFERTRFYGINTDGSAHHFRLGVVLPVNVIEFLTNKYSHFELMGNKRLESGLQNKVFYIELMIKEAAKK